MTQTAMPVDQERRRQARKATAAAAVASSLEWYDFFIYGTAAALVFNQTFFYTGDPDNIWRFSALIVGMVVLALVSIALISRKHGRTHEVPII